MGSACCEVRDKDTFYNCGRTALTSADIEKIDEIYSLAAFSTGSTPGKTCGYTYQQVLDRLVPIVTSMQAAGKLPQCLTIDWENVKTILNKRIADNPDRKYSITRDIFIQLWQIADDARLNYLSYKK